MGEILTYLGISHAYLLVVYNEMKEIFLSNDPCRDWLNLAAFDSKDPRFLVAILSVFQSLNPTFLAPEFVN